MPCNQLGVVMHIKQLKTIIAVFAAVLCFASTAQAAEKLVQEVEGYKITFKIPKGYKRIELSQQYGEDELEGLDQNNTALFQRRYSRLDVERKLGAPKYEEDWEHGAQLFIMSGLMSTKAESDVREDTAFFVLPDQATPRKNHDKICEGFVASWGQFTFDFFDDKTKIGHCVNWAGAFTALTTYQQGEVLIIVGPLDSIGVDLAYEEADEIDDISALSTKKQWALFREAANTDDAYKLIRSVKIKSP